MKAKMYGDKNLTTTSREGAEELGVAITNSNNTKKMFFTISTRSTGENKIILTELDLITKKERVLYLEEHSDFNQKELK